MTADQRIALVLGGADSLQADVAAYKGPYHGVVACNDAGIWWPGPLDAWVSIHPERFHLWETGRKGPTAQRLVGQRSIDRHYAVALDLITEPVFPGQASSDFGSSGLYAAKVALHDLKFDLAVLCGIPLSITPHFYGGKPWAYAETYRDIWKRIPTLYRERMRSMSGWTREFLGAPEWGRNRRAEDAAHHEHDG